MWRAQSTWVRIVINTTGQPLTPPSFSSRGVVKPRGTGSAKLRFGSLWKAFHSDPKQTLAVAEPNRRVRWTTDLPDLPDWQC
jgi:hypothetical protein